MKVGGGLLCDEDYVDLNVGPGLLRVRRKVAVVCLGMEPRNVPFKQDSYSSLCVGGLAQYSFCYIRSRRMLLLYHKILYDSCMGAS